MPIGRMEVYPWFWSGKECIGERVNDVHLTIKDKQSHGLNTDQTRIKIN